MKKAGYAKCVINVMKESNSSGFSLFGPALSSEQVRQYFTTWILRNRPDFVIIGGFDVISEKYYTKSEELGDYINHFDVVECWFDTNIRGQISLVNFIVYLSHYPYALEKIVYVDLKRISSGIDFLVNPQDIVSKWTLQNKHIASANRFWGAFMCDTPVRFASLNKNDLSALPFLYPVAQKMLAELPAHDTGLTATQTCLIRQANKPNATWSSVTNDAFCELGGPSFGINDIEVALEYLGSCTLPVVAGVKPDPIGMFPHQGESFPYDAYESHRNSPVHLTEFGEKLVANQADMAANNPIHQWWGNTEITNNSLWRWNSIAQILTFNSAVT
jgi:hypothetical protein